MSSQPVQSSAALQVIQLRIQLHYKSSNSEFSYITSHPEQSSL